MYEIGSNEIGILVPDLLLTVANQWNYIFQFSFSYVQKENYVFIRDKPAMNHLMYNDYKYRKTISVEEKVHCPFAIATKPFMRRKRAFAYPRNSTWMNLFDPEYGKQEILQKRH